MDVRRNSIPDATRHQGFDGITLRNKVAALDTRHTCPQSSFWFHTNQTYNMMRLEHEHSEIYIPCMSLKREDKLDKHSDI